MSTRIAILVLIVCSAGFFFKFGKYIDWANLPENVKSGQFNKVFNFEPRIEPEPAVSAGRPETEEFTDPEMSETREPVGYPVERTVTDIQGRPLAGAILGKKGDSIAFRRSIDQREFVIGLDNLSQNDREYIGTLPEKNGYLIAKIEKEMKTAGRRARWYHSYYNAQKESQKLDLPTYILFTGTDWCEPCQQMEREIFNSEEFKEFANRNLVLVKIDVPRGARLRGEDLDLKEKYSIQSYPSMVLLTPEGGKIFQDMGGKTNVNEYIKTLDRFIKDYR